MKTIQQLLNESLNEAKKQIFTGAEIERIANENNLETSTVIPGKFSDIEYLTVKLKPFVTAYFVMNNKTFDYEYSHTYDANKDRTVKTLPKIFR